MATPDDCFEAEAIVKADPGIQTLLKERYGITNMDEIACDPWSSEHDCSLCTQT